MLGLTIALFIRWLKVVKGGDNSKPNEGIAMGIICTAPRLVIAWTIILISFLFMDLSKLNLLWICPLSFLLIVNLRVILKLKQVSETPKK